MSLWQSKLWTGITFFISSGPVPIILADIGGRVESWLPIDYKLPVVFGLVVNFGDWKKLRLNFPLKSLTGNLKQMTGSDCSTVSVNRFCFFSPNLHFQVKASPSRHGDKSHSNESWMSHSPSAHPRGPLRAWERPPNVGYSIIPIH